MQLNKLKLRFLGSLFLPLLVIIVCSVAVQCQVVHFADLNLEMAVREALKNHEGSITADDMARLIELNTAARGITDLSGLEYAVNLQSVDLGRNQTSDISPLAKLANLEKLALWDNHINDIAPLAHLVNLKELDLSSNNISDISSPLADLKGLEVLGLGDNSLGDISSLV